MTMSRTPPTAEFIVHPFTPPVVDPPASPTPLSSVVGAAKRITAASLRDRTKVSGPSEFAAEAWELYDEVGEQHFLITTLAGRCGQAILYVGRLDSAADPLEKPEPVKEGPVLAAFETFGASSSDRSQMLYRSAINLKVAGGCWFVGIPQDLVDAAFGESPGGAPSAITDGISPGGSAEESSLLGNLEWRIVSDDEIKFSDDGKVSVTLDAGVSVTAPADDLFVVRTWNPHPRYSWKPDSPTRAVLAPLRELVGLTKHVSAQVDSRLAGAGILLVPQSVKDAMNREATEGGETDPNADRFTDELIEAMSTAIRNRDSASAVVPLVIGVPDGVAGKIEHITFSTPLDAEARNLRDEAIRRLALGQDAPPELLLGMGSMNHWGAWLVQEDTIKTHVEPTLALICDGLTSQFLWPTLEANGMDREEARQYVVWYSVDHLITRPNRREDAKDLHDRDLLNDEALVRELSFNTEDIPERQQENKALEIVLRMVEAAPSLAQSPGIRALYEDVRDLLDGEAPDYENAPAEGEPDEEHSGEEGPPDTQEDTDTPLDGEAGA